MYKGICDIKSRTNHIIVILKRGLVLRRQILIESFCGNTKEASLDWSKGHCPIILSA